MKPILYALLACILAALILHGCTSPETLKGSGIPADAPAGYVKLCREHPEVAACREVGK